MIQTSIRSFEPAPAQPRPFGRNIAPATSTPSTALCLSTRPYQAERVLPLLARLGITAIDRPHGPDTNRLLARLAPCLTVLALDPRREADLSLIDMVSRLSSGHILVLTPDIATAPHTDALDAGADVSINESSDPRLISALVRALLRRVTDNDAPPPASAQIRCGDLVVNLDRREVLSAGEVVPLTATEFRILTVMAQNAGTVVDPAKVMVDATGLRYSEAEARANLKVYVRRIRRKLEACASSSAQVVSVRGFGYMLQPTAPVLTLVTRAA
jgi:DNA-binding response OmpR family regulator